MSKIARQDMLDLSRETDGSGKDDPANACYCSECRRAFKIEDCPGEWERESWEMPAEYLVHSCPLCCCGGMIDDYLYLNRFSLFLVSARLAVVRFWRRSVNILRHWDE